MCIRVQKMQELIQLSMWAVRRWMFVQL